MAKTGKKTGKKTGSPDRFRAELDALRRINRTVNGTLQLGDILSAALDLLLELSGSGMGGVYAPSWLKEGLWVGAGRDEPVLYVHRGLSGSLEERMQGVDPCGSETLPPPLLREEGIRSWLSFPLDSPLAAGRSFGCIFLAAREADAFDAETVSLLREVCVPIKLAVERAVLHRKSLDYAEELGMLLVTGQMVSCSLSLAPVLEHLSKVLVSFLGAQAVAVYDIEEGGSRLRARHVTSGGDMYLGAREGELRQAEGALQEVTGVKSPVREEPSILHVPIIWQDEVVGVVSIAFRAGQVTVREREVELARSIINQSAPAIANAGYADRLEYEVARQTAELRQRNRQLAAISTLSGTINLSLNLSLGIEEILERTLAEVLSVMEVEVGGVYLPDEKEGLLRLVACQGVKQESISRMRVVKLRGSIPDSVVESGQAVVGMDISPENILGEDILKEEGIRFFAVVPLRSREKTVGTMFVASRHAHSFTSQEVDLLTITGRQIGVAVENVRLYQAEKQQRRIAETLRQVVSLVNASLDLREVMDIIVHQAKGILNADACSISLLEEKTGQLTFSASTDLGSSAAFGISIPIDSSIAGRAVRSGQTQLVSDVSKDPDYFRLVGEVSGLKTNSLITAPLRGKGGTIGVLQALGAKAGLFGEEDAELLSVLAASVTTAVEGARLRQAEQHQREISDALHKVVGMLNESLDLDEVLQTLVQQTKSVLGADACSVSLLDGENNTLVFRASTDLDADMRTGLTVPLESSLAGRAIREGRTIITSDAMKEKEHHREISRISNLQTRSLLTSPIRGEKGIIGVIQALSSTPDRFTQDDTELSATLAASAATAIEKAWLLQEEQRRVRQRDVLLAVARDLSQTLNPNQVASRAISAIRRYLTQVDCLNVLLIDHEKEMVRVLAASHCGKHKDAFKMDALYPLHGFPLVGRAMHSREPIVLSEVCVEDVYPPDTILEESGSLSSVMVLPLHIGQEVTGAIQISSHRDARLFSADEVSTCQGIANQTSVAIENATLYERLGTHASTLESEVQARTAEIMREKERIETILESTADAIIISDVEGYIQAANPAFEAQTGYRQDEVTGQQVSILYADSEESSPGELMDVIREGKPWRGEIVVPRKDASTYDADVSIGVLHDELGNVTGFVNSLRDITQLKQLDRMRKQFVTNVSHELRTPLAIIKLSLSNLLRHYDALEDEKRCEMVKESLAEANTLDTLIQDILSISRVDSHRISTLREQLDISALSREWMDGLLPLAREKELELELKAEGPVYVWGNADQLQQVWRNLATNAIKFTPSGGRVTISCRQVVSGEEPGVPDGAWGVFSVIDNGVGIPSGALPHIFERFYRVSANSSAPGTGLGLAIAEELVTLHGGHIIVSSEEGRGSEFHVFLPAHRPPA